MATAIKNPNNFSPQFLADMKAGNPQAYKDYTTGKTQFNSKVGMTIGNAGNVWTVTTTNAEGKPVWLSFPNQADVSNPAVITDQFGKPISATSTQNNTFTNSNTQVNFSNSIGIPYHADPNMDLRKLQILQYSNPNALKDVLNGSTAYSVDNSSLVVTKNGQKISQVAGPMATSRPAWTDMYGGYHPAETTLQQTQEGSHLFWSSSSWDSNGNYLGGSKAGAAFDKNPQGNTINPLWSGLVGGGQPIGAVPHPASGNGTKAIVDPKTGYYTTPTTTPTTTPKPPVTPTTVPKPPVTPTTVPKPPTPTPTTVPKPPVTPTTVPKPPVPTTVPKPPAPAPHPTTTVPAPAPHPTTTTPAPAPHPTTTTPAPTPHPTTTTPAPAPHPTTTVPAPAPHPTTTTPAPAPHPTTTTPAPVPTTTPKASNTPGIPTLPSFPSLSGTNTTIKYPSEQYMKDHGVSPALAKQYGGKTVDTSGYTNNNEGAVKAMVDALGTTQSRKLFSDWIAQGFDPTAFRNPATASAFSRNVKSFMPSIASKGWGGVDPKEWTFTGSGVTHKTATVTAPGGGTTPVQIDSTKQVTAYGTLQNELAAWGLDSLTPKVFNMVFKQGISDPTTLTNAVRATPEYKQAFVGLDKYNADPNNTQKMTEQQYTQLAQQYTNIAQQYGLPDSFFSKQEIGQLVAGGVSAAQFNRRIANGYQVAMNADPATRQALAAQGVDFGHLLAYYLDPAKAEPLLTNKANQAQLQGYAQNAGIANFTPNMAAELVQHARTGANPDGTFSTANEKQALDVAAQGQGLTAAAPGSNAPTVDTTQLIGSKLAGFGGTTQAEAQQATQMALQSQEAPFQKAGGYSATNQGVTGAGSAPQ